MQAASLVGTLNLVSDVKALVPVHVWYHVSTIEPVALDQSSYTFHPIGDYTIQQDYRNHSMWCSGIQHAWLGYFTRLMT
jgi:hypothetical protein